MPSAFRFLALALGLSVAAEGSDRTVQDTPGRRHGHEMVYDEARQSTLLFGGFGSDGVPKGDTWVWDGKSWHFYSVPGPAPRKWAAAAYDSRREVVVLFGGRAGVGRSGPSLSDTWIWNGTGWRPSEVVGPSGRDHHRAVYDRVRDRVVLFGGWDGERVLGDTWEWDGLRWHHAASKGPEPRASFGMAYHDALAQIILMGGQDLEQTFSDTWTWDGSRWTELEVDGPGPRSFHAMSYDVANQRTLLYGGRQGDRLFQDTWAWDGHEWKLLATAGPVRRGIFASAFDRVNGTMVIHGSGDLSGTTWELEATTWVWTEATGWVDVGGFGQRQPK